MNNKYYQKTRQKRYIKCKMCEVQIPKNKWELCGQCINIFVSPFRQGYNNNDGDDNIQQLRE